MFNLFKKKEKKVTEPGREHVVPRLKAPGFLTALKEMDIPPDQMPVTEPFVGELLITYAFDLPEMFQMVSREAQTSLGLSTDIRDLAIENLRAQLKAADIVIGEYEDSPMLRVEIGDNLEACSLLDTDFWTDMPASMGLKGETLVVAPHRDLVFLMGSDEANAVEMLSGIAQSAMEEIEDNHVLSKQVMVLRNGKWELLAP